MTQEERNERRRQLYHASLKKERQYRDPHWTYRIPEHLFRSFPATITGWIAICILVEIVGRTQRENIKWVKIVLPYYAWMFGVSRRMVQRALKCLVKNGLIEHYGSERSTTYTWTDKGVRLVADDLTDVADTGVGYNSPSEPTPMSVQADTHVGSENAEPTPGSAKTPGADTGVHVRGRSIKDDVVSEKEDEVRKGFSASHPGAPPGPPQTKKSVHEQVNERLAKIKATASDTEPEPPRRRGGRSNPPSSSHITGPEALTFHLMLHPEDDPRDIKSQMHNLEAKIRGTESEAECEKLREEWRTLGQRLQSILVQFGIKKLNLVETCS